MGQRALVLLLVLVLSAFSAGRTLGDPLPEAAPSPTTRPVPIFSSEPRVVSEAVNPADLRAKSWSEGYRRGINLSGGEFTEEVLPGVHGKDYFYPPASSLDYYRDKGLTLIRLPFRWERLQPKAYGPLDQEELQRIDAIVAAADARDMQILLTPFGAARYYGDVIGSPSVPNEAFANFWRRLAAHYQGNSAIWAYGLMNEPQNTDGRWPAAAQAAVDAIREVDEEHIILVPGDHWSDSHLWVEHNGDLDIHDPSGKLMYEAHTYFDDDHTGRYDEGFHEEGGYEWIGIDRVRPFIEWCESRGNHCFVAEYGVPDNDPRWLAVLEKFLTYLDEHEIGGAYWAGGPWWGDEQLSIEPRKGKDRPQMSVLTKHLGTKR